MNKEIFNKLKNLKDKLKEYSIEEIALIGSQAREDYKTSSDVDIVILKGEKDYFKRYEAIKFLSNKLNKKVDLIYLDSIRPIIKEYIQKDLIYV